MTKFKILDTSTGLYSHGGYNPYWTDRGKSWDSKHSISSHLKTYRGLRRKIPESWVVVEFKVVLNEINRTSIKDLLGEQRSIPATIHISGKDICRTKNSKKQKSKYQKKTGKQSKD